MKADRKYEVVLFGATGFVGRLTAQYLASRHGAELRWALAGRDPRKLEQLRAELGQARPDVLIADAGDRAALDAITRAARVVVTTVGPYMLYGRQLVASCAEHGTDYCDLTGEVTFMAETVRLHHDRAAQSDARIVHACGFDSIPSDLGTLLVQTAARERHRVPCREVKFLLQKARGGFSGGTFASMLTLMEQASKDRSLRRMLVDPYSLNPPGS
ncbi:MAG TPA: saccharopine dehydrogenase NADP-binding domain-containing protein [Myxococcaceae bacterium]|nr:saccharopine dehydrogenase NADP-binding domain-containing protein [Myxococcaceae bacterium]